jgi:hypothetical protein
MRSLTTLAVLAAAFAVAPACQSSSTTSTDWSNMDEGDLMRRTLRSYHAINSAYQGQVGYLKVYDVTEAGGPVYQWKYVYDLDYNELGFIDQWGKAYRYHRLPVADASAQRKPMRVEHLPADSTENNVMRMLGIDPALDDVTFPLVVSDGTDEG